MSYIKAAVTPLHESHLEVGTGQIEKGQEDLDCNLEDEVLSFILGVIEKIDNLAEGEALVIWKEIF